MKICIGIIATNEAEMLKRNLPALGLHFPIVAIDFGSSDSTRSVLEEYCQVVETKEWPRDFSKAKNMLNQLALDHGYDWMFMLDADETIDTSFASTIKKAIEGGTQTLYYLPRIAFTKGDIIEGSLKSFPDLQARIFSLTAGYEFRNPTHCLLYKVNSSPSVWEENEGAVLPVFIYHLVGLKPKSFQMARVYERWGISQGYPEIKNIEFGEGLDKMFEAGKPVMVNLLEER